jgi:MATE family multidrug resistance protein
LQIADSKNDFSHRAIWRIAAPMILSALSVPLLGLVDTAVMGHMEAPRYLAAVAAGATIFNVLFLGLNFLRMGTTGVAAQAFGAADERAMSSSLLQPLALAVLCAALLLLLQRPIVTLALQLLAPEAGVSELTARYFDIRIWSAPAALTNLVLLGWLLGNQDARGPLAMVLLINLSNIALDLWLVVGLDQGVAGVARASVVAEYAGCALGAGLVVRTCRTRGMRWYFSDWLQGERYARLFRINFSLFVRSLALMFALAFITARGARLGATELAINALLLNFLYFFSYAQDGMAHAAEALTGKAAGARDRAGLALAVRRTLQWTALFAVSFAVLYGLAGPTIIRLLTDLPVLREAALTYLPWIIALPLVAAWCFLYDGIYVGLTRTQPMMVIMVGALLLVFLPAWWLLRGFGNHALWAALILFMAARSISMHAWFVRLAARDRLLPDQGTAGSGGARSMSSGVQPPPSAR